VVIKGLTLLCSNFTVEGDDDDIGSILKTSTAAILSWMDNADDLPHHIAAEDRVGHSQCTI